MINVQMVNVPRGYGIQVSLSRVRVLVSVCISSEYMMRALLDRVRFLDICFGYLNK